jgi:hypothetical protein
MDDLQKIMQECTTQRPRLKPEKFYQIVEKQPDSAIQGWIRGKALIRERTA